MPRRSRRRTARLDRPGSFRRRPSESAGHDSPSRSSTGCAALQHDLRCDGQTRPGTPGDPARASRYLLGRRRPDETKTVPAALACGPCPSLGSGATPPGLRIQVRGALLDWSGDPMFGIAARGLSQAIVTEPLHKRSCVSRVRVTAVRSRRSMRAWSPRWHTGPPST